VKLMILDGNSVINRAFYGVRLLSTKDGVFTNAIYGFLNILQSLITEEAPDALCVAFDRKGPTFRHLQYADYKGTRKGMPEELAVQLPLMKQVLQAMRIPIYELDGWEADDILGTAGRICGQTGWDCMIVTGDRDSLQLIDEHVVVKLVTHKAGQTQAKNYTEAVFKEEYGFEPKKLIVLKSLMGDSSDNIPGVPGIGQKTGTDLLLKFGSLDGIYAHLEDGGLRESVVKKLETGKDSAYLSYDLATIRCDAPVDFKPEENLIQEYDKKALYDLFVQLEFVKLIDRYRLREQTEEVQPEQTVQVLAEFPATDVSSAVHFAQDSVAIATEQGVFCAKLDDVKQQLKQFLESDGSKCCWDLKALYHLAATLDVKLNGFDFDVLLAAYVLNPSESEYSIQKLSTAYLQQQIDPASPEQCASALFALRAPLEQRLQEQQLMDVLTKIELPLCPVLAQMEQLGILVDRAALEAFGQMLDERITKEEQMIYELAGERFNILSPKQLGVVLFEKLQLPAIKKTKTGYSTNADVLEKLKREHPIVARVLDYRMLTKLKSTYADGLLKVIAEDGRIHTTFQNTVTATGRLSSTDPNLQNIPVRTELGSEIRRMFVAKPGWVLVDADYSQIELRVLAHIADDKHMQEAFIGGEDVHAVTASQVFGVPLSEVTSLQRRHAKAVNFGIVYGISEFSLAEDIGVSRWEAKAYIDAYLEKYAGVRAYMHEIVQKAKQDGWVDTLYGRRRQIPEIHSSNFNVRSGAERIALNTPIQGTAADIIKLAMIAVERALREAGLQARLILQVHDELIVECPAEEAIAVSQLVMEQMRSVAQLSVPLVAEAKFAKSWYDAK